MREIKKRTNPDFEHILLLIQEARSRVYSKANAELVMLYFNVGGVVSAKVAVGTWGDSTVNELAAFIQRKQPGLSGFTRRGLYRMKQFYETYTDPHFMSVVPPPILNSESKKDNKAKVSPPPSQKKKEINRPGQIVSTPLSQSGPVENQRNIFVSTVLSQIQWSSHLHILNKAKTPEEKLFYLLLAIKDKLSVRELERQLNTAVFERTMLSSSTVSAVRSQLPDGLFKDPYIFEFLNLPEAHSETDLEKAIISNLQKFILEIGKGFTYMGRQYPLQVGNKDYRTDLLFYNRDLQCLVLFELKIEEFAPEFLGKLNFYLEALDRDVKRPHENPSIGILLCKGKDTEVVEYAMARNTSPTLIAEYETKLIDKKMLAAKLHQLVEILTKHDTD
jgi:predicted nuclease of restriction endonuclease-like (RecB) superfamily